MNNSDFIYQEILNDPKLSKEQKILLLNKVKEEYDKLFDTQRRNEINKYRTGAAFEIASSAIPMGGAGKLGAKIGTDLLKSKFGRKISQEIGSGVVSGLASGAVFGAGRGMLENKNPKLVKQFPELIKDIKNAKYMQTNDLYKNRKDDIKNFHILKNNNKEFLIGENLNKENKFYLSKESIADQGLPPRLGGASISDTNFIIPDQKQAFNPPSGQDTKIFTREQIDKMSLEEFSQNEAAIMKQLREKGIPTSRELEKSSKTKQATKTKASGKGHWVTINGNHVFIED